MEKKQEALQWVKAYSRAVTPHCSFLYILTYVIILNIHFLLLPKSVDHFRIFLKIPPLVIALRPRQDPLSPSHGPEPCL